MDDKNLCRIEIEDTSDCATCERRQSERFELFREVRLHCSGNAWCQECGRKFTVMIEGASYEDSD